MRALLLAGLFMAVAEPVAAQSASPIDAIVSMFKRQKPIGENPKYPPPMDEPALPWFSYRTDKLGRPTYLDEQCLNTAKDYLDPCVQGAILEHRQIVDARNEQIRIAEEKAAAQAKAESAAKAKADREAQQRAWEDAQPKLTPLQASEQSIRSLKARIASAQRMIDEENEVGRVSGFVNKQKLYSYGQMIVFTRRGLASEYAKYRRLGGRKALSAI